ncbi:MAG: hypothetical protein R6V83_12370 [Candidatus Thorarchaeota archaeon]
MIEPKESIAISGTDIENHHLQLHASLDHIRFSTKNVFYEKNHEREVFFHDEMLFYRDTFDGVLFTRLGAFTLRGKCDSDGA